MQLERLEWQREMDIMKTPPLFSSVLYATEFKTSLLALLKYYTVAKQLFTLLPIQVTGLARTQEFIQPLTQEVNLANYPLI